MFNILFLQLNFTLLEYTLLGEKCILYRVHKTGEYIVIGVHCGKTASFICAAWNIQ